MLDSLKFCVNSKNLKQISQLTVANQEPLTICTDTINILKIYNIKYTAYNIRNTIYNTYILYMYIYIIIRYNKNISLVAMPRNLA